ncbi:MULTISPECIES: response regulator [Flavobacterium]|uniref:CheY chemotaxis protein or a CheY-like REC (Receiver) domain n=1 Tax=Flavobacterium anhuiense TaxID=459526 RepID=A0AAC9D5W5_9FLAO|nr:MULTISPECIES: response regulator [Flavobacterium]AOC97271.1 Response regulator rcp1 [Flavobacterium anhuiense]EJG02827.1 response regulator receiver protein [Flavobacterium sp. F52]URM35430.1 response regulator [Flavobacterium anhuiense]SCY52586.1 CheY chemotaxis protein or a CheY-like REC (receiver) domain [Flavobacterium anhuiense]
MTDFTIFYTDDDEDDLCIFADAVESIPHNIKLQTYSGSQNFLNAISESSVVPSVIFLDLNMPGKNGFDVLEELRSSDDKKDIPVVIYSTSSEPGNIEKCLKLGANCFITKPVLMSDIIKAIEHAIQIDWKKFIPTQSNFVFKY